MNGVFRKIIATSLTNISLFLFIIIDNGIDI